MKHLFAILLLALGITQAHAAIGFNGTDQYVNSTTTVDLSGSPKLTVALWFNIPSYDTDSDYLLSNTALPSSTAGAFQLVPDSSTGAFLIGLRGNVGSVQKSFPRPTAGVWHHLVAEWDMSLVNAAEVVAVWVDGIAQTLTTINQNNNTGNFANATVYLGCRGTLPFCGESSVDNVSIWSGVLLNSQDVQVLYQSRTNNAPTTLYAANLKLSWKLDEAAAGLPFSGAGSILDQSGNGETGTPNSSPLGVTTVAFSPIRAINATSGSYTDVKTAVDNAIPGDIVLIPAGSNTWTSQLLLSKSIGIIGAGTNSTIITDTSNRANDGMIKINGIAYPRLARVRNMTIYASSTPAFSHIQVQGTPALGVFMVDDMSFRTQRKRAIWTQGLYGLVDTIYADGPFNGTAQTIRVDGDMYNGLVPDPGDTTSSWMRPLDLGSTNYVYVQGSTYDFTYANDGSGDSYFGGRRVDRDNLIINNTWGVHGCDSGFRSAHSYEFYRNRMIVTGTGAGVSAFIQLRGGTGVLWSNQFECTSFTFSGGRISLDCYRATGTNIYPAGSWPAGPITGSNPNDGNLTNGWLSLDQIGATSPTAFGATNTVQTQSPLYQWANLLISPAGTTNTINANVDNVYTNVSPNAADMIKLSRDYFNSAHPSYTPLGAHPLTATNAISPASATLQRGAAQVFSSSGGSGPYWFQVVTNNSGGTIDHDTGAYVAGFAPGVDTVRVWDAWYNYDDSEATVTDIPPPDTGSPIRRRKA